MNPIFIGGAARSGTTVFATRLGERLGCAVLPEAYFLAPTLMHEQQMGSFSGLQPAWRLRTWGLDESAVARIQEAPSAVEAWSRALEARGVELRAPWIEHSPHNLRYCATLTRAFPNAHFVHLVRDGRAVGASLRRTDFGPHTPSALARWWVESVAVGLAAQREYPERVSVVRFEDFLADPSGVLDGVASTLDLGPIRALAGTSTDSPVGAYTRKHHNLVDGRLRADRSDSWKGDVSVTWVKRFEQVASPLLSALGYDLSHPLQEPPSQVQRVTDPMIDGVIQLVCKAPRRRFRRWKYAR